MAEPRFTMGIEEEYLLVDLETRDLVRDPPPDVMAESQNRLQDQVGPEFLRSQIEVGTKVCSTIAEARADLGRLRHNVAEVASAHGMGLIAASTHPFAKWGEQLPTDKDRYLELERDMQAVVRRLVICGMHVHVGVEDDDLRIDLMNQVSYFLPHILAASTSSPFWHGNNTGLKSYRMTVFKSLPRTGLPEHFSSWGEYQRHVNVLVEAGIIQDATKLWWDVRPSARYPTIEMRVADVCTRIEDAMTVATLFVLLLRMLYRRRRKNQRWRTYANMLVAENIWRAQRYGVEGSLMDYGRAELVPFTQLADELIEILWREADETGTTEELKHLATMATRGTSADRQLAVYSAAVETGADSHEALKEVVDMLIRETIDGI
ncbi:MAG: carboxylate-amine ligase [Acidimicrobiia bacterium]|nr:carboxylate-amine ligase [Acidimicrobiia bacterium]